MGNFLLGVAALIFIMISYFNYTNHPRGGDAAVGHAWVMVIGLLSFVICMVLVAIIIGVKGGFSWVGQAGTQRTFMVLAGFCIAMWGVFFFTMGEGLGRLPRMMQFIMASLPFLAMASVLFSAFFLLNEPIRNSLPTMVWRMPVYVSIGIGLIPLGFSFGNRCWNIITAPSRRAASEESDIQRRLAEIDATDLMRDGVFLYHSTDKDKPKAVRERALTRIKSRPDWQDELVRRLQNDWAPEAFTFLASNEVDNKAMFAEPVRQGVLIQARLIRENIRGCRDEYSLYASKYNSEVDRVLRTVDKFEGLGVDYRPAVQELRHAMDEPVDFDKPKLMAIRPLDKWLKKHE